MNATPDAEGRPAASPSAMPSATIPDWSREAVGAWQWHPSRKLLRAIRDYQRHRARRSLAAKIAARAAVLRYRFWSVVTGADIPPTTSIGGGLLMPHPNGIVIHPDAVIGPNCLLMQQVTLGAGRGGAPRLAGHVDVGAGAKVLGGVAIGTDAVIGACALVLRDVPAGITVAGVPAVPLAGRTSAR